MGSEGGIEGAHDSCSQLFMSQMQAAVSALAMIAITHPIRSNHGIVLQPYWRWASSKNVIIPVPGNQEAEARQQGLGRPRGAWGDWGLPAEVPPWCPLTPGRKPGARAESKPG